MKKTGKRGKMALAAFAALTAVLGLMLTCENGDFEREETDYIVGGDPVISMTVKGAAQFQEAVAHPDVDIIKVAKSFTVKDEVVVNSDKTIILPKGKVVAVQSFAANADVILKGGEYDWAVAQTVYNANVAVAVEVLTVDTANIGVFKITGTFTVAETAEFAINEEAVLVFDVVASKAEVNGRLLAASEDSVYWEQYGGGYDVIEGEYARLTGGGAVRYGDGEAVSLAEGGLALARGPMVTAPAAGGDNGDDDDDDEQAAEEEDEKWYPAIVTAIELSGDDDHELTLVSETDAYPKKYELELSPTQTAVLTANLTTDKEYKEDEIEPVEWLSKKSTVVSVESTGRYTGLVTVLSGADIDIQAKAGGKYALVTVKAKSSRGAGLYDKEDNSIDVTGNSGSSMLEKAFDYINKSGANNDGEYTIILDEDETETTADGYTIGSGAGSGKKTKTTGTKTNLKITIQGLGENVTITKTAQGALFTVYGNAATDVPELVLENIKLKGYSGNNKALVIVGNTTNTKMGKLTMKTGSRITGNISSAKAGGVNVEAGGNLTMDDGRIDNNKGAGSGNGSGGVRVAETFTMNGGVIEDNEGVSATAGAGGVFVLTKCFFIMNDGTIQNNKKTATSGNGGGGVYNLGTFTMNDGTITGNTSSTGKKGVAGAGTFTKNGGTVQED